MPRLVDQDVEEELPRRHRARSDRGPRTSGSRRPRLPQRPRELLELAADRGAVVEQRRRVAAGQTGVRRQRLGPSRCRCRRSTRKMWSISLPTVGMPAAGLDRCVHRLRVDARTRRATCRAPPPCNAAVRQTRSSTAWRKHDASQCRMFYSLPSDMFSSPQCQRSFDQRAFARVARARVGGRPTHRPDGHQSDQGRVRLSGNRCWPLSQSPRRRVRSGAVRLRIRARSRRPPITRVDGSWRRWDRIVLTSSTSERVLAAVQAAVRAVGRRGPHAGAELSAVRALAGARRRVARALRARVPRPLVLDLDQRRVGVDGRDPRRARRQPQQPDGVVPVARRARAHRGHVRVARRGAHSRRGVCGLSASAPSRDPATRRP